MACDARLEYISIGGNRHPSAAAWSTALGGLLAYGAGHSIALWNPLILNAQGVVALLNGHTGDVNAIRFLQASGERAIVISGSADKTIRAWIIDRETLRSGACHSFVVGQHEAGITTIDISPNDDLIVSGSADSTVKVWSTSGLDRQSPTNEPLETIKLKLMLLAIAIHHLYDQHNILAVAGSHSTIHIYLTHPGSPSKHVATLAGHAGWIRALSITIEHKEANSDLLLASASQDKFIRLWRIHIDDNTGSSAPTKKLIEDPSLGIIGRSISTKVHRFSVGTTAPSLTASITFEALLLGHEDWIYTAKWQRHPHSQKLQLLSASADSSLAIWESDAHSGIWVCVSRLGEISAQKGSTTATGSTGGFWIGLWAPDGTAVASMGRTGSWRVWRPQGEEADVWSQSVGCGGHVKAVNDVAWAPDGSCLLSTSADQTTRLHAEWRRSDEKTWHEFARPQIHGYDLNCIDTISTSKFVSGAEEKPIRVFQEPSTVAAVLSSFCGIEQADQLPSAANIPVLGLSNKEIEAEQPEQTTDSETVHPRLSTTQPPIEDDLARHLLFPEIHKVYGHGLEISALAISPPIIVDGEKRQILASACRASSIDHAVIRLHDTTSWREYAPPLKAHSLTVTALEWSQDGRYLLSTSRDRMFSIFEHHPQAASPAERLQMIAHVKEHSRMILDCAWAPDASDGLFVTAGRDKCVKIWKLDSAAPEKCVSTATIALPKPATAVAVTSNRVSEKLIVAGLEDGAIVLATASADGTTIEQTQVLSSTVAPTMAITRLAWRPAHHQSVATDSRRELAISSEDCSLRILSVLI